MERHFGEVRIDFFDEDTNKWSIDAWVTDDDNEEGKVIGTIDAETLEVKITNNLAKNDEVVFDAIKSFLEKEINRIGDELANFEDGELNGWDFEGDNVISFEITRMNDKWWADYTFREFFAEYDIDLNTLARYLK